MKHKYADLMLRYAKDAMETNTPWLRWEFDSMGDWEQCNSSPEWYPYINYRRKPDCHNKDDLTENGGECYFATCKHHCKDEPLCGFEPKKKVVDLSVLTKSVF